MPYKDLRFISNGILGETYPSSFERKVLLVMYYSELLAINFEEIESFLNMYSRERLFNIFYLDANFVEHIYALFLNSGIDTIMPEIFDRLIRIQELLHQRKLLKSCKTSGLFQ
jgi:hypothetical protein